MTTYRPFALLALFFWLSAQALHAQPFFPDYKEIRPNNIRAWLSNHGRAFQGINENASFFFPANSGNSAIFLSSPWVAAQFEGDTAVSAIRTAAVQNVGRFGTEYRLGRIRQIGSDSLGVDYNRMRHRIYHLRRGDNRENSRDFREYPIEDGAPTDVFGNPRILGSETMWSVASDVGGNRRFSQLPAGIELHQQVYGIPSDNQFYIDSVQSVNGRFGSIVPNNLPNGIRRIEIYDLQGRLRASVTPPNGVWNGRSSSNVSMGAMPLSLVFSGFRVNALPEETPPKPLPTAFRLGQNYPNPFNPTTTIPIQVPRTERVVLKVFDVLGREVATLLNETLSQNEYLIPFNAGGLSSGVYFYRVQAGEFLETKKMMLVK